MAVDVERWGVVHEVEDGAGSVRALGRVALFGDRGMWYPEGLEHLGDVSPRAAVMLAALHRRWRVVEVCDPARVEAVERAAARGEPGALRACASSVSLRLSRSAAYAWRRLLAQWAAIGTLGEPGEELARELAAALGEELGG